MAGIGPADRLQLVAALLSRFNHDLRTPLNTISGWSYLLQQDSVEPARIRQAAEVIGRNGRDQMAMLDTFIDDARIVVGRLPMDRATFRIDEVVVHALAPTDPEEQSHRPLQVRIEAEGAVVDGDRRLLQRLLERLAVVAVRRAHDSTAVEVDLSRKGRSICVLLTVPTNSSDWTDSDLLELRLSTLMAATFGGTLELFAGPGVASLRLLLPEAA